MAISKTRLWALVKELRADGVAAGLRENPGLIEVRDDRGRNLLHLCASVDVSVKKALRPRDGVRLAEVLLGAGIDIDAPAFTEGDWCATPLWYAVARGRGLPLQKYLLEQGATPEHCLWAAAYHSDLKSLTLLLDFGASIDAVAENETPLLHAMKYSRFAAARLLLRRGADPNFRDSRGMTALHYMLKKGADRKHYAMFIESGARGDIGNADGVTASEIMSRKRDPVFREMARSFST